MLYSATQVYEILGVPLDVITATTFLVAFCRHYDGHQGVQVLLFIALFLPGTVLSFLWMRHGFPMSVALHGCVADGERRFMIRMMYGSGMFLLSFFGSWLPSKLQDGKRRLVQNVSVIATK